LNKSTLEESLEGLEDGTIFVIVGSMKDSSLPADCFNRMINPRDLNEIAESLIDELDGEVYIPEDEEFINFIGSDPFQDPFGCWNLLIESEWNQKKLKDLEESSDHFKFVLALLLKILSKNNFKLFIGSTTNSLN
jgi:hypothetical protein